MNSIMLRTFYCYKLRAVRDELGYFEIVSVLQLQRIHAAVNVSNDFVAKDNVSVLQSLRI